jgi:hypothetical protein
VLSSAAREHAVWPWGEHEKASVMGEPNLKKIEKDIANMLMEAAE